MNISFSETSCKHLLMYDRPRRRNFYLPKLFQKFQEMNIGWFFYIGGNDSMDTIKKLSDYAILTGQTQKFLGVPKTIDNDLALTDHTPWRKERKKGSMRRFWLDTIHAKGQRV